jgi:hypothetical protein
MGITALCRPKARFFKARNQRCIGEPVPKADLPDQGTMEVRSSEDTVTFSDGA